MALITGLQPSDFLRTLMRKALVSFPNVMARAQKHMDFEDMFGARLHTVPLYQQRQKRDCDIDRP